MHYCTYKTVNENNEGKLEICIECKKKVTTKKDPKTGRIDNKKYLASHMRDVAQPTGRTAKIFKKYYGEAEKDLTRK